MGSSATKEAQSNSTADEDSNLKPIADEIALKRNEITMLFLGNSNSGKTTIISNIVDSYSSTMNRSEFIRTRYDLELFTIREYTDPSIPQYSSASFKYLELIHKYSQLIYKQSKNINSYTIAKHIMSLESTDENPFNTEESICRNGVLNSKYDERLVFGFFRCYIGKDIDFPMDLKDMILRFYDSSKSVVISYKFTINDKVYNLWDTSGNDFMCGNVSQLYPWINDVIFVLDPLGFNETVQFYRNKMSYDIKLFQQMKDDIDINYNECGSFLYNVKGKVMVIVNKKDKLKEELEKMTIQEFQQFIGVHKLFDDENMNDLRYDFGLNSIREIFAVWLGGEAITWNPQIWIHDVQGTDINDTQKLFSKLKVKRS